MTSELLEIGEELQKLLEYIPDVGATGIIFGSMITFLISQFLDVPKEYLPEVELINLDEPYDFIIIGAGTAGSALATHLSEIHDWKVLLIEAGDDPPFTSDIPGLVNTLQRTSIDWNYTTVAQSFACHAMPSKSCAIPRGKVLGGTSVLDEMVYMRGNNRDFNRWEKEGCTGWSWKNVLPYFEHFEQTSGLDSFDLRLNGHTPQLSSLKRLLGNTLKPCIREFVKLEDIITAQNGFSLAHGTIKKGTRQHSAKIFLNKIDNSYTTLEILKNTFATKLIIHEDRAIGVEVLKNNEFIRISVSKEVIISAGTINTPKLLMLSGIGPKMHLEKNDIPVVKNLNVGKNLHDHVMFPGVIYELNNVKKKYSPEKESFNGLYNFLMNRNGSFTSIGMKNVFTFVSTLNERYPDIQIRYEFFFKNDNITLQTYLRNSRYTDEIKSWFMTRILISSILIQIPVLIQPQSRGEILLSSKDPLIPLQINPNYLDLSSDAEALLRGIRFAIQTGESKLMKERFSAKLVKLPLHNCKHHNVNSDLYWKCALKCLAQGAHNLVGTAQMRVCCAPEAVVDPQLKVHGISGLRVVDASVIPIIPSSGIRATVTTIANKASDFIKEDWLTVKKSLIYEDIGIFNKIVNLTRFVIKNWQSSA